MLLFVILSVCLFVASAGLRCLAPKLEGYAFNLATNENSTFHVDYVASKLLLKSGDDFTLIDTSEDQGYAYIQKDGECKMQRTERKLLRCIPEDAVAIPSHFGLPGLFPLHVYMVPTALGPMGFLALTPRNRFPVLFGYIGPNNTVTGASLYYDLVANITDTSVFDVDLTACSYVE